MGLFSKKGKPAPRDKDDEEELEDEEEIRKDMIMFGGAVNGKEANLQENAKLVQMALIPVKELLTDAVIRRAGIVRFEPKGQGTLVLFVIDGVPFAGAKLGKQQALAYVQMIKLLAGLDISIRYEEQQGGIKAKHKKQDFILHCHVTPTQAGEQLVINFRNPKVELEDPNVLGFPLKYKEQIRELAARKGGLLLTCGPPGTGVTTMMHGVLRSIDSFIASIFSVAETDIPLPNVREFNPDPEHTIEQTIARIERDEADVLLVDPIDHPDVFKACCGLAENITFLSEFPAKDSVHGLLTLIKWAGDVETVATLVHGIAHGKLIRLLCDKCKQAFRPNPRLLQRLGLPPETDTLYRHFVPPDPDEEEEVDEEDEFTICRKCGGLGYYGQQPLLELLVMTDELRDLIRERPDPKAIRALMKKQGMFTVQDDGLRLVAEGKTDLEELKRIFG